MRATDSPIVRRGLRREFIRNRFGHVRALRLQTRADGRPSRIGIHVGSTGSPGSEHRIGQVHACLEGAGRHGLGIALRPMRLGTSVQVIHAYYDEEWGMSDDMFNPRNARYRGETLFPVPIDPLNPPRRARSIPHRLHPKWKFLNCDHLRGATQRGLLRDSFATRRNAVFKKLNAIGLAFYGVEGAWH